MADAVPLLDSLHPLREPPAPESIVPYLVMAGAGMVLAALVFWAARRVMAQRLLLRRSAEAELVLSRGLPPPERLAAQAMLLRRIARVMRGDAVRAQGTEWLARLDALFATSFFSRGEGQAYGADLYSPRAHPDVEALDRSLAGFIGKIRQ